MAYETGMEIVDNVYIELSATMWDYPSPITLSSILVTSFSATTYFLDQNIEWVI